MQFDVVLKKIFGKITNIIQFDKLVNNLVTVATIYIWIHKDNLQLNTCSYAFMFYKIMAIMKMIYNGYEVLLAIVRICYCVVKKQFRSKILSKIKCYTTTTQRWCFISPIITVLTNLLVICVYTNTKSILNSPLIHITGITVIVEHVWLLIDLGISVILNKIVKSISDNIFRTCACLLFNTIFITITMQYQHIEQSYVLYVYNFFQTFVFIPISIWCIWINYNLYNTTEEVVNETEELENNQDIVIIV